MRKRTELEEAEDKIKMLQRENETLDAQVEAFKSDCERMTRELAAEKLDLANLREEQMRDCERIHELWQEKEKLQELIVHLVIKQEGLEDKSDGSAD